MREPDKEVKEVKCSETGKAMPKIPQWMADVKVKFVCEEVRQRHTSAAGLPPLPERPALLTMPAPVPHVASPDDVADEADVVLESGVASGLHTDEDTEEEVSEGDLLDIPGVADSDAGDEP
ncbi:MAG: hypothetical protein KGJ62_06430 [Armatimonadetes bacterium]|nr:hypothetical protein [Armatimonadota bacterium]MDE2206551.1 hypothetical protein [Armatimonadota bacterium]